MPGNIDKRIVEMEFDNAQFESGVQKSTSTLNAFKQALNFDGASSSSQKFNKNFDLSGVNSEVEQAGSAFERMKNKVPPSIKAIGSGLLTMGKIGVASVTGISAAISGLAIKGGITRAMNLKQADFMLQGIVKDGKAVDKIMQNVNASVDGTAYSLDQAALVAAQFAATGMRGGEEMEGALKGVAGAAAVFGADYERVGRIFTQVAGQGRLMGNDLLQFSSMGMNAAATLADYLDKTGKVAGATEADVRDMVSKGKIDFETFAAAMNWAFGEQAAKANETFSGALANMKSALSRIGEKFASPVIDALRDLFNALRPLINMINSQMGPVFDAFDSSVKKLSGSAVGFLNKLGNSASITGKDLKEVNRFWGDGADALAKYFNGVSKGSIEADAEFTKFAKKSTKNGKMTAAGIKELVSEGKISYQQLTNALDEVDKKRPVIAEEIQQLSSDGTNGLKKLQEYFNGVNDGSIDASKQMKKYIKDATDGKKVTEAQISKLVEQGKITNEILGNAIGKDIWKDANKDLSVFSTMVGSLYYFISQFKTLLDAFKESFADVFGLPSTSLRDLADRFRDFADNFRLSEQFVENFKSAFTGFLTLVKGAISVLGSLFAIAKPLISGTISFIGILMSSAAKVGEFVVALANIITKSGALEGATSGLSGIMQALVSAFLTLAKISSSIIGVFISLATGITNVASGFEFSIHPIKSLSNILSSIFDTIGSVGTTAFSKIAEVIERLSKAFSKIGGDAASRFSDVFNNIIKAVSAGGLAGVVVVLNRFVNIFDKFQKGGLNINVNFFKSLSNCFDQLGKTLQVYQTTLKAKALKEIAGAILMLAAAVLILSTIDPKRLATALIGVEALLLSLFGTIAIFTKSIGGKGALKSIANMIQIGTAMTFMASAILILSGALKMLSTLSFGEITKGILAIAAMCVILGKAAQSLDASNKKLGRTSAALIVFALALNLMVSAVKRLGNMSTEDLIRGLMGVIVLIGSITMMLNRYGGNVLKGSTSLLIFAAALNVMAAAVKQLGSMDPGELVNGLFSILVLLSAIAVFVGKGKFGGFKPADATALLIVAAALEVLTDAVTKLGSMGGDQLVSGLASIGAMLGMIAVFMKAMSKGSKSFIGAAVSMVILASSMEILADVVNKLGGMKVGDLKKGLVGLAASLVIIAGAMRVMPNGVDFIAKGVGLVLIANAIATLGSVVQSVGGMPMADIGKGLAGIAGGLAAMVLALMALEAMKGTALDSAASILIMANAMMLMAPAISVLGSLPLAGIGKALLALAGAFAIFIAAAAIVNGPILLGMLGLSVAISSIGLACLAVGTAISMFVDALVVLGTVSTTSFENLKQLLITLAETIPIILAKLGEGLIQFVAVIAQNAGLLAEALMQLLVALLTTIASHIGEVVAKGIEIVVAFVNGIAEGLPAVIEAAFNLAITFIDGLANAIRDNQERIFSAVGNLISAIVEFVLSAFQAIAQEIPVVGDDIVKGLEKAKKAVNEKLNPKEGDKAGSEYGKGISGGIDKSADKSKKAGEKHAKQAAAGAGKSDTLKKAGETAGSVYSTALGKAAEKAKAPGEKLAKNASTGASKTSDINKAGQKGGSEYVKGVDKKSGDASKAGKNVAGKAKSGMGSVTGYSGLGSSAGAGFVSGARGHGGAAYSAGWSLASSFYNAIKARLAIKSPSKETYKLAKFAVQGFVKPAKDYASMVERSGRAIADSFTTGVKKGAQLNDILGLDTNQPVIRPVVDLSSVRSAASEVDSLFTDNSAIKATAKIGKVNSKVDPNGMRELLKGINKINQNGSKTAPVFNINQTIDGSENPENFANRFIRELQLEMRTGYYG